MKRWPLIVSELLGEGNMTIAKKEEQFMINLDQEKERFFKSIETYKETFNKIKQFKNLNNVGEYSADSFKLRQDLDSAFQKVQQFNEREGLFNQNKSEYPELLDLNDQFKPFFELTTMAHEIEFSFKDWT
jgi:dynein heavy chain